MARRPLLPLVSAAIVLGLAGCVTASVYFQPDDGWTTYASSVGFTVLVPAPLNETVKQLDNPNLGPIETHFLVTTTSTGVRYAVVYGDFPASYISRSADPLAESRQGDERSLQAPATEQRRLTLLGRPALEYRLETTKNVRRIRLVLDGVRLYALSVTGTAEAADGADARRFLESFTLSGG